MIINRNTFYMMTMSDYGDRDTKFAFSGYAIVFMITVLLFLGTAQNIKAEVSEPLYSIRVGQITESSPVLYHLAKVFPGVTFESVKSKLEDSSVVLNKRYILLLSMEGKRSKEWIKDNRILKMATKYGIPVVAEVGNKDKRLKKERIKHLHGLTPFVPQCDVILIMPGSKTNRLHGKQQNRMRHYKYPESKGLLGVKGTVNADRSREIEEVRGDKIGLNQEIIAKIGNKIKQRTVKRYAD